MRAHRDAGGDADRLSHPGSWHSNPLAHGDHRVESVASFVDVQLRGPYTLWHHTHTFEARDGGTLCRDEVRYRPRGGALMNWLFVRRDVERIFKHRQLRLLEILG